MGFSIPRQLPPHTPRSASGKATAIVSHRPESSGIVDLSGEFITPHTAVPALRDILDGGSAPLLFDVLSEVQALMREGSLEAAESAVGDALKENGESEYLRYYSAVIAFRKRKYRDVIAALKDLERNLRHRCREVSESAFNHLKLGRVLLLKGMAQSQLEMFSEVPRTLSEGIVNIERAKSNATQFGIYQERRENFDGPLRTTHALLQNPLCRIDSLSYDFLTF